MDIFCPKKNPWNFPDPAHIVQKGLYLRDAGTLILDHKRKFYPLEKGVSRKQTRRYSRTFRNLTRRSFAASHRRCAGSWTWRGWIASFVPSSSIRRDRVVVAYKDVLIDPQVPLVNLCPRHHSLSELASGRKWSWSLRKKGTLYP